MNWVSAEVCRLNVTCAQADLPAVPVLVYPLCGHLPGGGGVKGRSHFLGNTNFVKNLIVQ